MECGLTRPLCTKVSSVSYFIPGAAGLRFCRTYHGPMRALVALRPAGLFSIVHCGQFPSATSFTKPQYGQTNWFDRSSGEESGTTPRALAGEMPLDMRKIHSSI